MDEKLQRYFHFDEADLAANRAGQFSEKQKARLKKEDQDTRKWSAIGGIFFLLIAAIGPFGGIGIWNAATDMVTRLLFGLGFGVVWTLIWGDMAVRRLKRALLQHDYKIGRAQGHAKIAQVTTTNSNHTTSLHHELQIGGQRFQATTFLEEIMQGAEAVVYYIDRSADDPYNTAAIYSSDSVLSAELGTGAQASQSPSAAVREDASDPEMAESLRKGDKAGAIRRYRAMHGCDFEEARKAVEELAAG